jgi:hypothetical protein
MIDDQSAFVSIPPSLTKSYMEKNPFYFELKNIKSNSQKSLENKKSNFIPREKKTPNNKFNHTHIPTKKSYNNLPNSSIIDKNKLEFALNLGREKIISKQISLTPGREKIIKKNNPGSGLKNKLIPDNHNFTNTKKLLDQIFNFNAERKHKIFGKIPD